MNAIYIRRSFVLKQKNQKFKTAKCFLCRTIPTLQISQNHRAVPSGPASHPQACAQPEANALPTTQATMFRLISSGSRLLSEKRSRATNQQVKRAWGREKTGPALAGMPWAIHSVD